jgi:hypothetical protein
LRLINSSEEPQRLMLDGTPFTVTAIDGNTIDRPTSLAGGTDLLLPAGGRIDVAFVMPSATVTLRIDGTETPNDAAQDIHTAAADAASQSPRARLRSLAGAYRAWAVAHPHRYLLIAGTPLPDYTAPADTVQRARAVLGPFLAVFTHGEPTPAVLPLARQLRDWARREPAVAAWVAENEALPDGDEDAGHALAGAVLAWSRMHGTVSLEVMGQFAGMGHDPGTLFEANIDTLADAFGLE